MTKIVIFLSVIGAYSSGYGDEHFDHYKNLHLQMHVGEIKYMVEESKDCFPDKSYKEIMTHIFICQELLKLKTTE